MKILIELYLFACFTLLWMILRSLSLVPISPWNSTYALNIPIWLLPFCSDSSSLETNPQFLPSTSELHPLDLPISIQHCCLLYFGSKTSLLLPNTICCLCSYDALLLFASVIPSFFSIHPHDKYPAIDCPYPTPSTTERMEGGSEGGRETGRKEREKERRVFIKTGLPASNT